MGPVAILLVMMSEQNWQLGVLQGKVPEKPMRSIDDIFMLWTSGEIVLNTVCSQFNLAHPNIRLMINFASDEINFLDTTIEIKDN